MLAASGRGAARRREILFKSRGSRWGPQVVMSSKSFDSAMPAHLVKLSGSAQTDGAFASWGSKELTELSAAFGSQRCRPCSTLRIRRTEEPRRIGAGSCLGVSLDGYRACMSGEVIQVPGIALQMATGLIQAQRSLTRVVTGFFRRRALWLTASGVVHVARETPQQLREINRVGLPIILSLYNSEKTGPTNDLWP